MHFATVDFKRKMKIFEGPVGMMYTSAMLISNFRNCFYPNQISRYFSVSLPSLQEYITQKARPLRGGTRGGEEKVRVPRN